MDEPIICAECGQEVDTKTQEHVWDSYIEIYETRWGKRSANVFGAFHAACLDNIHLPEHMRVCNVCHKQGKDISGNYPGLYRNHVAEHPTCVDWQDIKKNRAVEIEGYYA